MRISFGIIKVLVIVLLFVIASVTTTSAAMQVIPQNNPRNNRGINSRQIFLPDQLPIAILLTCQRAPMILPPKLAFHTTIKAHTTQQCKMVWGGSWSVIISKEMLITHPGILQMTSINCISKARPMILSITQPTVSSIQNRSHFLKFNNS